MPLIRTLKGHELLGRISGVDAQKVTELIAKHLGKDPQPTSNDQPPQQRESEGELEARMRDIMNKSPVVLFMKGEPDGPRCGFSRKAVNLLREQKVTFTHFDILQDEAVRQGDVMSVLFCHPCHSFDDDRIENFE